MTEIKNGDTVVVDLDKPDSSFHKAEGVLVEKSNWGTSAGRVRITKQGEQHGKYFGSSSHKVGDELMLFNLTKAPGFRVGTKARYEGDMEKYKGQTVTVVGTIMKGLFDYRVKFENGDTGPVWHRELQRIEEPVKPEPKFKVGDLVTFAEPHNKHWQGGKAKVVAVGGKGAFSVTVEIIDGPPKNTMYLGGGQTVNFKPDHLKLMFAKGGIVSSDTYGLSAKDEKWAQENKVEAVDGPAHYGGKDNPYEVIKVAEAWGFEKNAYLFNALKYLGRAGKKGSKVEDLKKLKFYVDREIALEEASGN